MKSIFRALILLICLCPSAWAADSQPSESPSGVATSNTHSDTTLTAPVTPTVKAFRSSQEYIYKLRLQAGTGNALQNSIFSGGDSDREESARVAVQGDNVTVLHATNIKDKFWGTRTWYDHKPTVMRICPANAFDDKGCKTIESDTFVMESDKVVSNYSIDFKFVESGELRTRSIQVEKDRKPDEIK